MEGKKEFPGKEKVSFELKFDEKFFEFGYRDQRYYVLKSDWEKFVAFERKSVRIFTQSDEKDSSGEPKIKMIVVDMGKTEEESKILNSYGKDKGNPSES